MKTIKIKIINHNPANPYSYGHFFLNILKKYYTVELSENPDYLFYNESSNNHFEYDCIKIYFTGENIVPDFNFCDYGISHDYMDFEDRHYRLPLYLVAVFYNPTELTMVGENYLDKQFSFTKEDVKKKTEFCSFVYSNYRAEKERQVIFEKLSGYKKVNAGGGFLNNVGGRVPNKLEFEMKHKFSIAFEGSSRSGWTTEKIVSSMLAGTVPIYWGNPNIHKEFNSKRFINCHDYNSFDEVLARVKEVDTNDDLYLQMVNEPMFADGYDYKKVRDGLDDFLKNIFDQPLEKAKRRTINPVKYLEIKKNEALVYKTMKIRSRMLKLSATVYKPFKKFPVFEKLKLLYFKKIDKR